MSRELRAFYRFHASLMEPWDGPALIAFTDGTRGRRGARPQRAAPWQVLGDQRRPGGAGQRGRRARHRAVADRPQGQAAAGQGLPGRHRGRPDHRGRGGQGGAGRPSSRTTTGCTPACCTWTTCRTGTASCPTARRCATQQRLFGYTEEERGSSSARWRAPAPSRSARWATTRRSRRCRTGRGWSSTTSPSSSRRSPTRRWTRSGRSSSPRSRPRPALSTTSSIRARRRAGRSCCRIPVISDSDLAKIIHINEDRDLPGFAAHVVDGRYLAAGGGQALRARLAEIRAEVTAAISRGREDHRALRPRCRDGRRRAGRCRARPPRGRRRAWAPIPSLLLTGAVHHHLIRERTRTRAGLVVEAGDVRETPPHRAADRLRRRGGLPVPGDRDRRRTWPAAALLDGTQQPQGRGEPDQGARQGPAEDHVQDGRVHGRLLHRRADLRGDRARPGGHRAVLRRDLVPARRRRLRPARRRGRRPGSPAPTRARGRAGPHRRLETGGEYQWRRDGEPHLFSPEAVVQAAARDAQPARPRSSASTPGWSTSRRPG